MAEAVFGQKCSEDTKSKLTELMTTSGLGGSGFMDHLLQLCELEEASKAVPELSQDLTELQVISTRMATIYKNLCERVENLTSAKLQEMEQSVTLRDREIERLRGEIEERDGRIHNLSEAAEKMVNEKDGLLTRVNELTEVNRKNNEYVETSKALVDEYKEKNDLLLGKIKEAEAAVQERDTHLARIKELEVVVAAEKNKVKLKEKEIEELKTSHTEALNRLADRNALDTEKRLLDQRKYYEDEVEKIRTVANATIDEHHEKVKSMLDEIEALQKKDATTTTEPKKRGPKNKDKTEVNGKNEVNVVNEKEKETGAE